MGTTTGTIQIPRRPAIGIFQPSADRLAELNLWFGQEYRSLLRFAHFLTGDRTTAEDIVQEAFVRIYKAAPRLTESTFKPYARKAILNLSRSARPSREVPLDRSEEPTTERPDLETADEVWTAVMGLSPRQRAVVALRYYEGMNEAQIAAALQMSAGSVKKHTDRAMTKLRATLGEGRTA